MMGWYTPVALAVAVTWIALGCAPYSSVQTADESGYGNKGNELPLELARCWIDPGNGDFFDPDELKCLFASGVLRPSSIEWSGSYGCGEISSEVLVASEHDFAQEVTLARLTIADNTCPRGSPRTAYPVNVQIAWGGLSVVDSQERLVWQVQLDRASAASSEKPRVASLPLQAWAIEVHNRLAEARIGRIEVNYSVPLTDWSVVGQNSDGVARFSLNPPAKVRTLEFRRPQVPDADAPAEAVSLIVPMGVPSISGVLKLLGPTTSSLPISIEGPGRYALSDAGFVPSDEPPSLP